MDVFSAWKVMNLVLLLLLVVVNLRVFRLTWHDVHHTHELTTAVQDWYDDKPGSRAELRRVAALQRCFLCGARPDHPHDKNCPKDGIRIR